jgi:UDP-N-acetylglucosamine:LPS N-acetylglucosamine transferase
LKEGTSLARIVFTWELGEGMGHIVPYISLIRTLLARDHELSFILRDLRHTQSLMGMQKITCFQAPMKTWQSANQIKSPLTYAHILHNIGFDNPAFLSGLVKGWQTLFNTIKPDCVIFEHSPTALLAARSYTFKMFLLGTGFVIPPAIYPLPNLRFWLKPDPDALRSDEDRTLQITNATLGRFSLAPLTHIADLFTGVEPILTTFKELDPYKERENSLYYGVWTNSIGEEPEWPKGNGKRVFLYLKSFPALHALLVMIEKLKLPSIIYIENLDKKLKENIKSTTLKFVDRPQDMNKIAAQCDFAILNATHNTTANLLLAGKPALHLPIYLEQSLTAKRIEELGMGTAAHILKVDEIAVKLDQLLSSDSCAAEALEFAALYKQMDPNTATERAVNTIDGGL